jgi:hypothetical protein
MHNLFCLSLHCARPAFVLCTFLVLDIIALPWIPANAIVASLVFILRIVTSSYKHGVSTYYQLLDLQLDSPSAQNPPIEFKEALFTRLEL